MARSFLPTLVLALLACGCHAQPAPAAHDGGPTPIDDDAAIEIDAAIETDAAIAVDDGGVPSEIDASTTPTDAGTPSIDVRALGPGLGAYPIDPLILADTRDGGGCVEVPALGPSMPAVKIELERCAMAALPTDPRAAAVTVTVIPRDPAPMYVQIGHTPLWIVERAPATHHLIAPLFGGALVVKSDGREADLVVELTAVFAPENDVSSRARILTAPLRAISTFAGEASAFGPELAPGVERVLSIADLAPASIGVPPEEITGVIAVAHVVPRASCAASPFSLALGPERDRERPRLEGLTTVARCDRELSPWSEGVVIGTRRGALAVRLEGAEADVALDVIGFMTNKRSGAALLFVPLAPVVIGADLDGESRAEIPVRGALAVAGSVRAWAIDRGTVSIGVAPRGRASMLVAPERQDETWLSYPIDGIGVAVGSTVPARVEISIDSIFAF